MKWISSLTNATCENWPNKKESLNSSISIKKKKKKAPKENPSTQKTLGQDGFTGEFYETFKKDTLILNKQANNKMQENKQKLS